MFATQYIIKQINSYITVFKYHYRNYNIMILAKHDLFLISNSSLVRFSLSYWINETKVSSEVQSRDVYKRQAKGYFKNTGLGNETLRTVKGCSLRDRLRNDDIRKYLKLQSVLERIKEYR